MAVSVIFPFLVLCSRFPAWRSPWFSTLYGLHAPRFGTYTRFSLSRKVDLSACSLEPMWLKPSQVHTTSAKLQYSCINCPAKSTKLFLIMDRSVFCGIFLR
uniref:(northern house mosquito) hypothetical protein n=1 Tax=Culex pipiens TaxID=7175 RepID=A0A8D8E4R8_CULPI